MSGFTDWYANKCLQDIADNGYISLHYDSPELDGLGGSEIAGAGYARQLTPFSMPSNRVIWTMADSIFTGLNSAQLTHFGVWTDQTNGNMFAFGELPSKLIVLQGQGYVLKAGDIAISIA